MDLVIFEAFMGKKSVSFVSDETVMPEDTVGFTYIRQSQTDETGKRLQTEYRIGIPFEDIMSSLNIQATLSDRLFYQIIDGARFGVYQENGNNHIFTMKETTQLVNDKQELIEAFNAEMGLKEGIIR